MGVQPRLDDLDVSSARLFLTVAELGSVSKAAARHGMSQPSATARIQKLERQIGLQLLQRGPTGSTVTDDGLRIAEWCASLVAAAGELTAGARSLREAGASHLHIAATATVARHLLSRWVASGPLETTHIDLTELSTVEVAHALREGTADIGFLDGRQRLHVLARAADVMRRDGTAVYPRLIEEALGYHEAVKEVCAVQVKPEGGILVAASLRRAHRHRLGDPTLVGELEEHMAGRLEEGLRPQETRIFEEVPRSVQGKVLHREVREVLAREQRPDGT